MLFPAIVVAGPLLVIETSACAVTVVFAVALLLPGFVSALEVVAVAVLLRIVPFATLGSGCTVIVNCALPPFGNSEMVHATVPPLPGGGVLQVAAGPVSCTSETNVTPAGRASVNEASLAASGPAFDSVIT